ncbi:class D sortase [Metabacillus litoralis]|uniref:Class D sortase n=1 Tax=Metabacillus litoralis TaxID=152268 RepID=A0A5C6W715_9BACI|nr:class D sortase [Metabacillus litoralis]TXC91577.1 class D sortase [Metabacillus litoralis]
MSKRLSIFLIVIGIAFLSYQLYWILYGLKAEENDNIKIVNNIIENPNQAQSVDVTAQVFQEGEKLGSLIIPKLDQTIAIFEGDSKEILKKGIGHVITTPLPGEENNSVLAGHRDTFFRNLDKLEIGDKLLIERSDIYFIYKIKKIRIVDKDDKTVIVPRPRSTLTLTTCYPFTYIGPAPQRYIIEAELIKKPKIEL